MKTKDKNITKSLQRAGVPIWQEPIFAFIVLILASGCDFITIYSVTEYYLAENMAINIAITGAVAFILNFLPSLLGNAVADKNTKNRKLLIVVLSTAFLLLFLMTFLLRWTSRSVMFEDTANLNLLSTSNVSANSEISTTPAQDVLTILIGSSTFFTSVLSFIFSATSISKGQKIRNVKELRVVELEEKKDIYKVHMQELEKVLAMNNNKTIDDEAYEEALKRMYKYRDYFKEKVKIALSEYLHDPKAVSPIMNRDENVIY